MHCCGDRLEGWHDLGRSLYRFFVKVLEFNVYVAPRASLACMCSSKLFFHRGRCSDLQF
jgi:hypothetical protein